MHIQVTLEIQTNPAKPQKEDQDTEATDASTGNHKQDAGSFEMPKSLLE